MTTLAERITEAMDGSGVTVRQVATACGVTYQAVHKWRTAESHTLKGEHLIRLAELTGYEPRWIINGEGPKVRLYAHTEAQATTLKAMESLPDDQQRKIAEIAQLIATH